MPISAPRPRRGSMRPWPQAPGPPAVINALPSGQHFAPGPPEGVQIVPLVY
ncbi:hypothetical protein ACT7CW_26975 [Bacillus pacificus]